MVFFRKKYCFFLLFFLNILFFTHLSTYADSPKIVRIGVFNLYPAIFKDSDGQIKGFYTEMLDQIAHEENWQIKYVFGTWNEGLERIKNREVDLLTSVAFTEERAQYLSYGNVSLLTVWSEIYVTPGSSIDGLLDLNHKKIAVMKGDYNAQNLVHLTKHLKVEISMVECPDFDQVMQYVKDGKVDAGVVNSIVGAGKGRQMYDLKTTGIIFNSFDIFFATKKNYNLDILRTLDTYLEKWKKNEHSPYYTARDKWTHASDKQVFIIPQWLKIAFVVLISCMVITLVILYVLKRRVSNVSQSLKLTHQQYRDIFDSSPVALWVENLSAQLTLIQIGKKNYTDLDTFIEKNPEIQHQCKNATTIIDTNSVAINKYGIVPGDKYGAIGAIYGSRDSYKEILKVLWNNSTSATCTVSFVNFEKKPCVALLRLSVGTNNLKDYKLVYFTLVDITELVSVQNELIRQKNELSAMLSCIGDAVMTFDMNGKIISMNSAAMQIIGKNDPDYKNFTVKEWLKYKIENSATPPDNHYYYVTLPDDDSLVKFTTSDKKEFLFEQVFKPLIDEQMNIIGSILLLRDVTQLHKIMEQVQKYDRLDSIGLLAGGIAHDFNNLLGGIFGYLELLKDTITDSKSKTYLDKILKVFDRTKNLANQLITFSKGSMPVKKAADISNVVKECVNFALSGSETTRDFTIDPQLSLCEFDINQISQVIDNITINASQAMKNAGHIHVDIFNFDCYKNEVKSLDSGKYVCISIHDQGPGIEAAIIDKIFDPFFTTKETGNGLGLATSYSIMKKHKGMITAESKENEGTTFKLFLPVAQPQDAENKFPTSEHKGTGLMLVLDDEESIRETVCGYLSTMGYTPLAFSTGDDLIVHTKKMVDENQPLSGFILDMTLPGGMNGRQCLDKIREICKEPFVIAMSGYAKDLVIDSPNQFGFCYSIKKPFLKNDLANALNHCCRQMDKDTGSST